MQHFIFAGLMIYYKTQSEVELMRASNLLVSKTHSELAKMIKPGITSRFLNDLADTFIQDHKAKPAFKGYNDFPAACCMSINDAVVHGFPSDYELRDGDIISIDIGVLMNDFVGDSAYTFAIGEQKKEVLELLGRTKVALYEGIAKAVVGNRVGDIGFAIQDATEKRYGYGVVRELTGHGVGRHLHEEPEVPNYGKRGNGTMLKDGLVIAIEPMINLGDKAIFCEEDGWTIKTKDGTYSAHYEHSVVVRKGAADILSSFDEIESNELKNPNLNTGYYEFATPYLG